MSGGGSSEAGTNVPRGAQSAGATAQEQAFRSACVFALQHLEPTPSCRLPEHRPAPCTALPTGALLLAQLDEARHHLGLSHHATAIGACALGPGNVAATFASFASSAATAAASRGSAVSAP